MLVFYRLPIIGTVMGWLWVGNIVFCSRWGISIHSMFRMQHAPWAAAAGATPQSAADAAAARQVGDHAEGDRHAARAAASVTALFTVVVGVILCLRVWGDALVSGTARPYYQAVLHPFGAHALLIGLLFCPARIACAEARWGTSRAILRTMSAPARQVTFDDVIFADCLTSMARGLSALEVLYCLSHTPQAAPTYGEHVMVLHPHCSPVLLAVMMAVPYWWRLQQCLRKYAETQQAFPHLVNALKYCTAFPLIIVDRFGPMMVGKLQLMSQSEQQRLWFACALLNGVYCFTWDVTMDWGLAPEMGVTIAVCTGLGLQLGHGAAGIGLLHGAGGGLLVGLVLSYGLTNRLCRCSGGRKWSKAGGSPTAGEAASDAVLRNGTVFPSSFCAVAVVVNLIIRMIWVIRLVRLPAWFPEPGVTALVLEICELCRRALWINLRVAWESLERGLDSAHKESLTRAKIPYK